MTLWEEQLATVRRLITQNGGLVKTSVLLDAGVTYKTILTLAEKGRIVRARSGYYSIPDAVITEEEYIVTQFADGVLTMETALFYRGYLTERPRQWRIAVSKNISKSRLHIETPELYPYFSEESALSLGAEPMRIAGHKMAVYNIDRLICDVLKFQERMATDDFRAAIRAYIDDDHKNIERLVAYASERRVRHKIDSILGAWIEIPKKVRVKAKPKKTVTREPGQAAGVAIPSDEQGQTAGTGLPFDERRQTAGTAIPSGERGQTAGTAIPSDAQEQTAQTAIPRSEQERAERTANRFGEREARISSEQAEKEPSMRSAGSRPEVIFATLPSEPETGTIVIAPETDKPQVVVRGGDEPDTERSPVILGGARATASDVSAREQDGANPSNHAARQASAAATSDHAASALSGRSPAALCFDLYRQMEMIEDMSVFHELYHILTSETIEGRQTKRELQELCEDHAFVITQDRLKKILTWGSDRFMEQKWVGYCKRQDNLSLTWKIVMIKVSLFVIPLGKAIALKQPFTGEWMPDIGRFLD